MIDFFSKGHERTLLAKKNIAGAFLIKGGSIFVSLILVPITINYISPLQFGVWLTISSFLTWFAFFDIGFGNGLKNKLAEAIANDDYRLGRIYVSTTYFILLIISLSLLLMFFIANYFLDWAKILNAPSDMAKELSTLVLIMFGIFAFQFVLQLINVVTAAKQNTIISSLIGFLGNILTLVIIFVLSKTTSGSLLYIGLAYSISPILIFIIFSFVLFKGSYSNLSPSLKWVDFSYFRDLMGIGMKFFMIQVGMIFFYNANNIIISNVVSPEAVTSFNIAFKYFSVITMIGAIVMAPFWPAFTEANAKGDDGWIRSTVKVLVKFSFVMLVLGLMMLILSSVAYKYWVGTAVKIPFSLSLLLFIFTVLNTFRSILTFYFNGIGKIMVQLYLVAIAGIINIPLAIFLGRLYGVTGVMMSTTLLCFICGIVEVLQYNKLINKRADGIWNK